jgi:signal transduction histidine kinase
MLSEFLNLEIPSTFLSLKEEREVKKKIRTELVLDGIINSEELASFLVELKVYNNNKYYYPLWKHPKSNLIVSLLEKSRGIIINSLNIDTSVNKTSKVVYTLKNFEAKDSKGHSLRINLKEDIENVLTIYDNYIKNKITVKKLYKNVVPFYGFSDLVQVWTNIIFNSIQALKGNGEICITIDTLENKEDFILVTIEDNGPGIPEENQSKIYEPFFTTKASGEGSGLGLYLSKKIIQRHKGEISFQSTPGKTVFSIKLPIKI